MDTDTNEHPDDAPNDGPGFPKWLKWGLFGGLAVLVIGYGLIFLYAKVINDSPDELDTTDLNAALAEEPGDEPEDEPGDEPADEPADGGNDGTVAEPDEEPSTVPTTVAEPATTEPPAAPGGDEVWTATDASELGYRVKEVLFGVDTEAVGRTNQIVGSIVVDGSTVTDGEFIVDVASIESDDGRRDNQFRGRIMAADEFPEAVFTLTEPIELGTEATEGAEVATTATGELTLRGVTNPVVFDLTARLENGRIGVLGSIPVLFEDYDIPNPSFGGITTEDNGLVEFVLVFEQP
jgi:polyisoprenoid-binding protein YceI